jgi:hypothetical protein
MDGDAIWGKESDVNNSFARMKTKFIDKQMPVIMGEYGTYRRGNSKYVPKDLANHNGLKPFYAPLMLLWRVVNNLNSMKTKLLLCPSEHSCSSGRKHLPFSVYFS